MSRYQLFRARPPFMNSVYVHRQPGDLSRKINTEIHPVKTSRKIKDEFKVIQIMPDIRADTCTSVSKNIKDQQLDVTYSNNNTEGVQRISQSTLEFSRSAGATSEYPATSFTCVGVL